MHFIKIKVTYTSAPKSVWRSFYVVPEIKLDELGAAIVAAFNGMFEHSFSFSQGERYFYSEGMLNEYMWGDSNYDMHKFTLQDLLNEKTTIKFCYDPGEDHHFTIKLIDGEKDIDFEKEEMPERNIILEKGRGYGIFEDCIYIMHSLLSGKDMEIAFDNMGISPGDCPFDFPLTIDEYFAPLDIEELDSEVETSYMVYQESVDYHGY